jgi:ketosteroid isomerase-like protein
MNKEAILKDFEHYTNAWIKNFNQGNVQYCIDAYTQDAVLNIKNVGDFKGKEAIAKFWNDLTQNANHIEYLNTHIHVIDEKTVHLNSDWKMNIAEGIITLEEWVKQDDGSWKLVKDAFEITKQY